jgi:hypothetical protein
MDLSAVLTRNPNAAYRIYDGQATVVLPDRAEVHVINEVGSLVWDRIDGRRTLGQILDEVQGVVTEGWDVGTETLRHDVLEFVRSLREHGMVV